MSAKPAMTAMDSIAPCPTMWIGTHPRPWLREGRIPMGNCCPVGEVWCVRPSEGGTECDGRSHCSRARIRMACKLGREWRLTTCRGLPPCTRGTCRIFLHIPIVPFGKEKLAEAKSAGDTAAVRGVEIHGK